MKGTSVAGMSRKTLQTALYKTTEGLAAELAAPASVSPDWSAAEWVMAQAVATIHGITPLLGSSLRWRGPDGWKHFLRQERDLAQRRYRRIGELLGLLDEGLRVAGVPAVGLKGAALYGAGLYAAGTRPMADVDILVRACDRNRASKVLEALGFQESSRFWKNTMFSASERGAQWRGQRPGEHPIKIELHERICEKLPERIADITASVFAPDARAGLNPYQSRASLIAHLLLHAAGSIVEHALRLIQLNDIALLAGPATVADWAELMQIGHDKRAPWWAFPPLSLTALYYPGCIPRWVLEAARSACPAILRWISIRQTLTSVSLSFPWVEAFPGIAWSSSPWEALAYVARRVARGEEVAIARRLASRSEPGLSPDERRWLAVSQRARICQWLVSRPARPLTMRVVRSSFGMSS